MHTVAIYSFEDRLSAHRQKVRRVMLFGDPDRTAPLIFSAFPRIQADEAYQVGKGMTPVGAYLAQDAIIDIALEHGVDMIHPG